MKKNVLCSSWFDRITTLDRTSSHKRTLYLVLAAALCLFTLLPAAHADEKAVEIPIKNPRFAPRGGQSFRVRAWTFEAMQYIEGGERGDRLSIARDCNGPEAVYRRPDDRKGVILEGKEDMARADLFSAPLELKPFHWVEVTVDYAFESGDPLLFVGLRPTENQELVDIEFLPGAPLNHNRTAKVRLHTGAWDGDYSLSVCLMGKGAGRYISIRAGLACEYPRPERPVVVLDIGHDLPPDTYESCWRPIHMLVTLFGFPRIEFIHFTEYTREKLDALDPALVLLSPLFKLDKPDMDTMLASIRSIVDAGHPVVGICMGHQYLARIHTDQGAEWGGRQPESGPTLLKVVKDDPLFQGLPRHPRFCVVSNHNFAVKDAFDGVDLIASSEVCKAQIFHYRGKPWYSFQAHIEQGWEHACPEACLLWKNLLRYFYLAP